MVLDFRKSFWKDYEKFPEKIKEKLKNRLSIFKENTRNPILKNHKLQGKLNGYRSINISSDIRAIYKHCDDKVIFIAIGTHSDLYQ